MKTLKLIKSVFSALTMIAALASKTVSAEDAPPLEALHPDFAVERDIPYIAGGDESQRLDLYLPVIHTEIPPVRAEKPLPLIVYIHGGGWSAGVKTHCWPIFKQTDGLSMTPEGYIVASLEYRFSQKVTFPGQIQDCLAAIRWLRANAARYNIDPTRVGVIGDSAGGHLVALVGTCGGKHIFPEIGGNGDQSDRVQAVCDIYGPSDFSTIKAQAEADRDRSITNVFNINGSDIFSSLIGARIGTDSAKEEAVSPVHYVSADVPPFLILHGTQDNVVPMAQSEELAAALQQAGANVFFQKIPGAGHGPGVGCPAVAKIIRTFFDIHLKDANLKLEPLAP